MKSVKIKFTCDRFEGDLAVLLERDNEAHQRVIPKRVLGDVKEGDILSLTFHGDMVQQVEIHAEETLNARRTAKDMLEKLIRHSNNN